MKQEITKHFNKSAFKINDAEIDPYIEQFMIELNRFPDITTLNSCEGHEENDQAYLFFNVSEKGWDIFWQNIMPELSSKFCIVDPKISKVLLLQTEWHVTTHLVGTIGISIHHSLKPFRDIYTWEDSKEKFWEIIQEVFLKYYLQI